MKATIRFLLALIVLAAGVVPATAQHLPAEQEAEKPNALEAQAYLVLEDVVAATPALKLPQNRSRLQIIAADLLWKRDQSRARSLFSNAAANILELEKLNRRSVDHELDQTQSPAQLRQELVLTAARLDPALGYELFQKTRRQKAGTPNGPDDTYLEQLLLTQSMATDPDFALRKVEAMLDRGEYSVAIVSVLENFQEETKPGVARLSEESLGRYRQLLENVVVAALKPAPKQQDNTPDLMLYLRPLLPQIEQHLPARAQAVRQKITERSENKKTRQGMDQLTYLTQQGTSNNLLNAAASAPSEMRDRLYQQAAFKAMDEGSVDRARQIANDHLDTNTRNVVLERIAAEQKLRNGKAMQLEELRQALAVIPDRDRVGLLLQLAEETDDPKHSRQFLDEAFGLVTRPATSYKQIEDQLQVAHVLGATEPQRSLDLLESGINKLNELLSAAASLSGFEFQIFKTSEMPLPGDSKLGAVVIRYGQELAILAKSDFGRAVAAADQFQYPESRLFVRLSIVQAVLAENKAPAK